MAGNDILLAGLRHTHSLGREGCLILADEIERLNTALAERDATIERLTRERDEARAETAKVAALAEDLMNDKLPGALETLSARAETAERERDEAGAEVERLRLMKWERDKALQIDPTQFVQDVHSQYVESPAALTAKGGENAD